ncbi:MAG: ribulose-phosphate 3-epimerase [Bacteroidales bacterium]|nr:ribulose-phosphate 3-epimerase [Bacteroidales bacterium]
MIAPSILSCNFLELGKVIELLNQSEADFIHIDVMDGIFVPNITIGFDIISQIKKVSKKPLDVHLMIHKPERYIDRFIDCGADILTIHYEENTHLHRSILQIKKRNVVAGVAINPHTPVALLKEIFPELDLVLIMSVNPGFGGQEFIESTVSKIVEAKTIIKKNKYKCLIEIDGGVNLKNYKYLIKKGVDILVAGNAIFSSKDILKTITKFKK